VNPLAKWPYNSQRWQRLRRAKLQRNPLCEDCLMRQLVIPAVAVDHFMPIRSGGDAFPPLDELTSLCVSCHNYKTRGEQLGWEKIPPREFHGCDIDGKPIQTIPGIGQIPNDRLE
jgi:5-methylcytosine-specific restriction enzyme A